MSKSSALLHCLKQLSETFADQLSKSQYAPPSGANFSVKSLLLSLLQPSKTNPSDQSLEAVRPLITDFILCFAALLSSSDSTSEHLSWIPRSLSSAASSAFTELSNAYRDSFDTGKELIKIGEVELEVDVKFVSSEKRLLIEFMPLLLPLLKDKIKESSIDTADDISAASAGVPAAYAIVAAHQLRWIVTQVEALIFFLFLFPFLG
ncbi:OLC1v1026705C1 [Oldenlandia corymbosa var. corymbosa]|uniref:OLC1v1026705C1 n=1 Tax=Oldenlandia corymbosa var. corymbosa TaxID=529605 RepID=A0AAV1C9W9_OLDCO|nr:OLC1v1026705C1 [Oldenlandia corymbosa var. corymbosa]